MARALRFQANLPLSFWGECILTAAFLINKLPTPILEYKSPHQVLMGNTSSYSSLRVFGCLCFAKNVNIQHKFDARAKPGIFVGYHKAKKDIVYMISKLVKSMFLVMLYFMSQFFHIMILQIHP